MHAFDITDQFTVYNALKYLLKSESEINEATPDVQDPTTTGNVSL